MCVLVSNLSGRYISAGLPLNVALVCIMIQAEGPGVCLQGFVVHRQDVASGKEVLNHRCESTPRLMETAPSDSAAAPLLHFTSQKQMSKGPHQCFAYEYLMSQCRFFKTFY